MSDISQNQVWFWYLNIKLYLRMNLNDFYIWIKSKMFT